MKRLMMAGGAMVLMLITALAQQGMTQAQQTSVQVYGNAAVVTGTFRVKGTENGKPYVRRERFTDMWIKINEAWQCVASQTTLIPPK